MIIDSTSTSTTGTNFQLLTQCRVRVTSDRVAGWGIREMAKIYSPPHYSEIYYPPHYRPATADPETHCCRNAQCRTSTLGAIHLNSAVVTNTFIHSGRRS